MEATVEAIERILRQELHPVHLEIHDDSALHAGHAGAATGGGHYRLIIVSPRFEGLSLLEQHRLVNDALRELIGGPIHALGLKTVPPSEWHPGRERG